MSNFVLVFVCTGNICRSPMAEAIMKDLILDEFESQHRIIPMEAISAGTHAVNGYPASSHAVTVSARHNINIRFHRSRRLTEHVAGAADLILTMEEVHTEFIRGLVPGISTVYELKRFLKEEQTQLPSFDVPDPIGRSEDFYAGVFDELYAEISRISKPLFKLALDKYRA